METTTVTTIETKPVTSSSSIAAVGYDPDTFTLAIRFKPTKSEPKGALYHYHDVGEEFADDFLHAESLGKFYAQRIKGVCHGTKITQTTPTAEAAPAAPAAKPASPIETATEANNTPPADEHDQLKLEAFAIQVEVRRLQIADAAAYALAGNELIRVRQLRLHAQQRIDAIKRPAYATYKATLQLEHDVIDPYKAAEDYLDRGMAAYRQAERVERLRREQEETRRRLDEAEAESKRRAAEMAEADARQAELSGNTETAQQIRQQPLPLVAVHVQPAVLATEVPQVDGIIERAQVWRWRVRPGEEHLIPRQYLTINQVALNAAVRAQKGLCSIPGIDVWPEEAKVGVRSHG